MKTSKLLNSQDNMYVYILLKKVLKYYKSIREFFHDSKYSKYTYILEKFFKSEYTKIIWYTAKKAPSV